MNWSLLVPERVICGTVGTGIGNVPPWPPAEDALLVVPMMYMYPPSASTLYALSVALPPKNVYQRRLSSASNRAMMASSDPLLRTFGGIEIVVAVRIDVLVD